MAQKPVIYRQRILCLWLPNWPIQRLVVEQPELKRNRVILFRQDSRKGQLVAAASPLARLDGVRIDMPLSEAKSLLVRGVRSHSRVSNKHAPSAPRFHILPYDPTVDLYGIENLAEQLEAFSPIIGLQQDTDFPECLFLDVTGLAPLFGCEKSLAVRLQAACESHGYLARMAIGNTVGSAQAMAQFGQPPTQLTNDSTKVNFIATRTPGSRVELSADSKRTNQQNLPQENHSTATNISITNSEKELKELMPLPVSALRLDKWIVRIFHQLGIKQIGQLMQLPRRDLTSRFGDVVIRRIDQLTGNIAEPIIARKPAAEFCEEQLLDYPTSHPETIAVIIERLIGEICKRLLANQQGALQWVIRLYSQHPLPIKLEVSLFQPTAQADHVVSLARMQLEQSLNPFLKSKKRRIQNQKLDRKKKNSSGESKNSKQPEQFTR